MNLAIHIVGCETYHQSARVWPWLGTEVLEISNGETCLFHHLSVNSLFQAFASLHESGYQAIEVALEVAGMNQQYLVALVDEHDDGSGERRPYRLAALGTLLADVGRHLHRCAAYPAELGVLVPVVQLIALACLLVKLWCELIEARAQATHLILGVVGDGLWDGECLYLCAICHRGDVEHMGPRLQLDRTFFTAWNGIGPIRFLFEQEIGLAEYKPIFHFSLSI